MREIQQVKPIRPQDIASKKLDIIPSIVFESFNELIVENFTDGYAKVKQPELINRIKSKMCETDIFNIRWLNIELAYSEMGWNVSYDKAGFNENYESFFIFKAKK
jgi:hypothetical protein